MSRAAPAVLLLGALVAMAAGCTTTLADNGEDPLVSGTDSSTEPFELLDSTDDRVLGPTTCLADTDCNDGDPCTVDTCAPLQIGQTTSLCDYTHKTLSFTQALAPTVDDARAVSLAEGYLYVAEGAAGVEVFARTSPSVLTKTAQVVQSQGGLALDVSAHRGGFVISMGKAGIQTYGGPPDFAQLTRIDAGSGELLRIDTIVTIDVSPGYCLGGGYGDGLVVFSINDLAGPAYGGVVNSQGRVVNAAMFPSTSWDHAFVADSLLGALVLSFNTPEGWAFIDEISSNGRVEDVAVSGQTGLFSEWGDGFGVADLSNPDDVDRLSRMPMPTPVLSVALLGPRTAVVGEQNGVVSLWDLSDGRWPRRLATWEGPGAAHSLSVTDGTVAVAMGSKGIAVLTTGCEPPPPPQP